MDVLEGNLSLAGPLLWGFFGALGFLLWALLQVEDLLDVSELVKEPVKAVEEILHESHLLAVVEGNNDCGAGDRSLVPGAKKDHQNGEYCRQVEHAKVEPGIAAVLDNECNEGLVKKAVLFSCDCLLLLEGADDALSSHRLVEVTVDWGPNA